MHLISIISSVQFVLMQQVLYSRVMVKEIPSAIFLIIFGCVATALLSALF